MYDTLTPRVVAGVDSWPGSRAAVELAAGEAALRRMPLVLVATGPAPTGPAPTGTATAGSDPVLAGAVRHACTGWPGLAVAALAARGEPVRCLVRESCGAALVVVGPPSGALPHGLFCAEVATHAWCPTLVVPPAARGPVEGPVLLGLTVSEPDEPTVAFAFEEASLRGARLIAVHVWSTVAGTALHGINPFAYNLHQARSAADRLVADALAEWSRKFPDVDVERMPLYDGDPAQTLLDASARAGLVVVGAAARTGSPLLGPVPRTMIQHAACPVAVVRRTGPCSCWDEEPDPS
ncbi:MAG TPA: universal stress protein [Micromonosporaceae bacterium]|nr:universal stress protein [Micromonosporaceae bacterium]